MDLFSNHIVRRWKRKRYDVIQIEYEFVVLNEDDIVLDRIKPETIGDLLDLISDLDNGEEVY